ncbi:MAG: hypothetical protein ACRDZ3_04060 [Acidimicrobiia bacterium]
MVRLLWTSSMRKHRVTRRHVRHVIDHAGLIFVQPAPSGSPLGDHRLIYLGDDETGAALEIMAVEVEDDNGDALMVIHAMALREKYRAEYEEARRWRR